MYLSKTPLNIFYSKKRVLFFNTRVLFIEERRLTVTSLILSGTYEGDPVLDPQAVLHLDNRDYIFF